MRLLWLLILGSFLLGTNAFAEAIAILKIPVHVPKEQYAEARDWYRQHLNMVVKVDIAYGNDGDRWVEVGWQGSAVSLVLSARQRTPIGPLVVTTDSIHSVHARLQAAHTHGEPFALSELKPNPWSPSGGWFFTFADHYGNSYFVQQPGNKPRRSRR